MDFKFLLGVKVIYLIDRTELYRIGGLVLVGGVDSCNEFA
jgi:hypothetical protein